MCFEAGASKTEFAVASDAVLFLLAKDMPGQTKASQKYPAV